MADDHWDFLLLSSVHIFWLFKLDFNRAVFGLCHANEKLSDMNSCG